ncbi:Outer membrane protein (OmpH-like) [Roseovarius sp. THAF27]|uniref:OmpH family outer membrane protein n=1 Tax=Roseovarius sp. THAF27 TaxID=2587850 RepID=UPI0012A90809|nr:OmpH family outer membrane protein [Roseovarius sp. THAF27]QFT80888.1 Outer membrane protein (OmpH-like) [Roseovarius sp. THAF27]
MRPLRALLMSVALLVVPAWVAGGAVPALAQNVGVVQSDILVVDPERLFEDTRMGQAITSRLQQEREDLIALNRKLESELEAEERALTEQRDTTSPENFRALADAFDEKVQQIRADSQRRVRQHERNRERAPLDFMRQVEPVLVELMREAGASVVMDRRTVLLQDDVVDITSAAVQRIDATLGDGAGNEGEPSQAGSEDDAAGDGTEDATDN